MTVRINELSVTITNLNNDKRRLEGDLANLQAELEEALAARRAAEDRADRTQMELNRLIEELRQVPHCTRHMHVIIVSFSSLGKLADRAIYFTFRFFLFYSFLN